MYQQEVYTAFVIGTATWDDVVAIRDDGTEHDDEKSLELFSYEQPGGSAVNTRMAFEGIAAAFNCRGEAYACMKLGETTLSNKFKNAVLDTIGDFRLMDPAYGQTEFRVPKNRIILKIAPEGGVKRKIIKSWDDKETHSFSGLGQEMLEAVKKCKDAVILNSRFPAMAEKAASISKQHNPGTPIILDFSESKQTLLPRAAELLAIADYVVVPAEAQLPGMHEKDPDLLMHKLINEYGCKNVAISDGSKPVRVFTENEYSEIRIPQVKALDPMKADNLGAGDTRDAALGFFLARGDHFKDALLKASVIASFSVTYPGRQWIEALPNFVKSHPVFADDFAPQFTAEEYTRAIA